MPLLQTACVHQGGTVKAMSLSYAGKNTSPCSDPSPKLSGCHYKPKQQEVTIIKMLGFLSCNFKKLSDVFRS